MADGAVPANAKPVQPGRALLYRLSDPNDMNDPQQPVSTGAPLEITCSRHFLPWLSEAGISLAFTTYQTNRLFLLGLKPDNALSTFERHFERPMGLYATSERLYMNSLWQLWELGNALPEGETYNGYDRLYVPRRAHTTGHLDVHDIALDGRARSSSSTRCTVAWPG